MKNNFFTLTTAVLLIAVLSACSIDVPDKLTLGRTTYYSCSGSGSNSSSSLVAVHLFGVSGSTARERTNGTPDCEVKRRNTYNHGMHLGVISARVSGQVSIGVLDGNCPKGAVTGHTTVTGLQPTYVKFFRVGSSPIQLRGSSANPRPCTLSGSSLIVAYASPRASRTNYQQFGSYWVTAYN